MKLNIAHQIEQLMITYVRTFDQVRGQAFELEFNDVDGSYDIVVQGLVIGEVSLMEDFDLYVVFFEEEDCFRYVSAT